MVFRDRNEAGRLLALALKDYRDQKIVVLALPRGGVPVAAQVARYLDAPLDLLLVRKIGVPGHAELAMGAVIDGDHPIAVRNEDVIRFVRATPADFSRAYHKALDELERRRQRYLAGQTPVPVSGRTVILVDDGIATGATIRAAIKGLRQRNPAAIVLAAPVAPPETVAALRPLVDDIVCLDRPALFRALSLHYADFHQVSDGEVIEKLAAARARAVTSERAG
ncbi:phosphoribosyltransferase [Maricaulis sp.]|uniref:phosphoribosyltransferase n=1 Tax=Maricaulis sp. TaxID=1486257 RepID=UPI0025BD74BD|nr:phosphoribosyltransferase [Maricaulis sp.]